MADKLMFIPNNDTQNFPLCTLNLIKQQSKIQEKSPKSTNKKNFIIKLLGIVANKFIMLDKYLPLSYKLGFLKICSLITLPKHHCKIIALINANSLTLGLIITGWDL